MFENLSTVLGLSDDDSGLSDVPYAFSVAKPGPKRPPKYRHISRNVWLCPRISESVPVCECDKPGQGDRWCGDACINRRLDYICDPRECPNGSRCTNLPLGLRPHPKCEVRFVGARGWGLFAAEDLSAGDFIDEYRGEVIDENEMYRRVRDIYSHTGRFFLLGYDSSPKKYLDSGLKGNRTRFVNHSVSPCNSVPTRYLTVTLHPLTCSP